MYFHAVVWLDHRCARVTGFNFHSVEHDTRAVESHGPTHLHHKAGVIGSGHAHDDPKYFELIADAIKDFREVLILGPADAKIQLKTYLQRQCPKLGVHVIGMEPMQQCGDAENVKFARDFFRRVDRMTPQL